jgi:hypothetical protein
MSIYNKETLEENVRMIYHRTVRKERDKGFFRGTRLEFTPIFKAFFEITQIAKKGIKEDGTQSNLQWSDIETSDFIDGILADIQPEYIQYPNKKYDYFERSAHKKFLKETAEMQFESRIGFIYKDSIKFRTNIKDSEIFSLIIEVAESIKSVYKYTPLRQQLKWTNNDVERFVDNISEKMRKKYIN